MKLATLDEGARGAPAAVLQSGEFLHLGRAARRDSLERWMPHSMRRLLEAGEAGLDLVRGMVARAESASEDQRGRWREQGVLLPAQARLKAPVPDAGLVLAAGLAYRSHLAEMSGTPAPPHPTAFIKASDSINAPQAPLYLPPGADAQVDFEGELAVVFGRDCHGVSEAQAMACVAGYTIANDVSARDWVKQVWQAQSPWEARLSWEVNIMGKQFPGFTCLGPVLLTADEVPDVTRLSLQTRLNGELMQSAPVSDLIFSVARMIAHFSRWYRFRPGDVLLTGTPAGVGAGRKPQVFMRHGDIIEVQVEGIGVLRNPVLESAGA